MVDDSDRVTRIADDLLCHKGKWHVVMEGRKEKRAFKSRVANWARTLDVKVASIALRPTMVKWVSISTSGRLSFNTLVLHLPTRLQDYVIVQELSVFREPSDEDLRENLVRTHVGQPRPLECWLREWLHRMASGREIGLYSQRLLDTGNQIEAHYFKRELLEVFRRDPEYRVGRSSLSGGAEETSYLQQFVQATGPNGEAAIMAILAHLDLLSARDQRRFSEDELGSGRISRDIERVIFDGEWPKETSPIAALMAAINEANRIVTPQRLFELDELSAVERFKEILPISHNSEKQFHESAAALDKLLSDNLDKKFFDDAGIPDEEHGKPIGSLRRLSFFLQSSKIDDRSIEEIVNPLRKVWKLRSKIAHKLIPDVGGQDFREKQDRMFVTVVEAVRNLCRALGQAYEGGAYREPKHLSAPLRRLY